MRLIYQTEFTVFFLCNSLISLNDVDFFNQLSSEINICGHFNRLLESDCIVCACAFLFVIATNNHDERFSST